MIANYKSYYVYENEALINAAKQALVWGVTSGIASKLNSGKATSKFEKKKNLKHLAVNSIMGAVAGAGGTMV